MSVRYLLVLDFEATCSETLPRDEMEIIEWPVVVIDVVAGTIVAEFHSYIRPTRHGGVLAPFCTSLTGITQAVVDGAPTFLDGYRDAQAFCAPYLEDGLFVTCGDWDLNAMLPTQCRFSGTSIPEAYQRWVNIKCAFRDWRGTRVRGMTEMLEKLACRSWADTTRASTTRATLPQSSCACWKAATTLFTPVSLGSPDMADVVRSHDNITQHLYDVIMEYLYDVIMAYLLHG